MSERWLQFDYRDFYDMPRLILVERGGQAFLLDSPFDEEADEYVNVFHVYRLSRASAQELRDKDSWDEAAELGDLVATIPASEVRLDHSKRESLSDSVFVKHEIE